MSKFKLEDFPNAKKITDFGVCGIYFLLQGEEVVYIGKSKNFWLRLSDHFNSDKKFDNIYFLPAKEEILLRLEEKYILEYKPLYNKTLSNSGYISKNFYRDILIQRVGKKIPAFLINDLLRKHNIQSVEFNCKLLFPKESIEVLQKDILSNKELFDKLKESYSVDRSTLEKVRI